MPIHLLNNADNYHVRGGGRGFIGQILVPRKDITTMSKSTESIRVAATEQRPGLSWLKKFALMGPTLVVAAMQFGPGTTVSAASAGASYGYQILWIIVIATLLMLVYTDMGIRIGLGTKHSPMQTIGVRLGRPTSTVLGVCLFILNTLFLIGSLIGASLGLLILFGGQIKLWVVLCGAVGVILYFARNAYRPLEKIMTAAVLIMVIVFAITAVASKPDSGDVLKGFIPSGVDLGGFAIFALMANILTVSSAFYSIYTIKTRGTKISSYRDTTCFDTIPGMLAPGVITTLIVITAASTIRGRNVESAGDLAGMLTPTLGIAVTYLFAVGLFAASFSSVMGNSAAGGQEFSDGIGRGYKLTSPWAKGSAVAAVVIGTTVTLIFSGTPVLLLLVVNGLALFVFPFLGAIMIVLSNTKEMGKLKNKWWQNVLSICGFVIVVMSAVMLGIEMFS